MKNKSLMIAIALLITACSAKTTLDTSCGQVSYSALADFGTNRVGANDVSSLNYLLTNSQFVKNWHSGCGANIIASPSPAYYSREHNLNCRDLNLNVDGRVGNFITCLDNNGKWSVVASDIKSSLNQPSRTGGCKP